MEESVHLGRIGGVRVGANWSLLPIFALVAWSLAVSQLPAEVGGYTDRAYWITAVVTAAAFFASLLAHELAHAFVARRHGIEVKGIVLWLLGGVAQLGADTPDPRSELRVALAGPAASLGLAATSGAAAWTLGHLGLSPLLVAALAWLGGINALLGVFNLLPAFPLDGGRVVRAVLWRRWGDRARATAAAAGAGRVVGIGLVGLGALEVLRGLQLQASLPVGGLWLALIGWFITAAAGQQRGLAGEQARLGRLTVADAMSRDPLVVPASATVAEVVEGYLRGGRFSGFPVGDSSGRIVGLTTVTRIGRVPREAWGRTPITAAAASPAEMVACRSDEPLAPAAARMRAAPDGRAIVIDAGRLVGIVTLSDVERAVLHADLVGRGAPGADTDGVAGVSRGW